VADRFVSWLAVPAGRSWLDVGCGTGALCRAILDGGDPARVWGIDPSRALLAQARALRVDRRLRFRQGKAQSLPVADGAFQVAVAGLVLNLLDGPAAALAEMRRAVGSGGTLGAYLWDYAEGMQPMRYFWDAATALDPSAQPKDPATRYPLCRPEPMTGLFSEAGADAVETCAIDVPAVFMSFEDFWLPFRQGPGEAHAYARTLAPPALQALRERLEDTLPIQDDGCIHLSARAWAVKGRVP
jgi:SAM-dependent methyltransferase